jgi:hypothetical protein
VPAEPSFVGRAASAGLAFVAKVILLAGLTWAVLFHAKMEFNKSHESVEVSGSGVHITRDGEVKLDQRIPRVAIVLPFVIGTLMLMHARRHDSTAHIARAAVGGGLAVLAGIVLVGPAGAALSLIYQDQWSAIGDEHRKLLAVGGALLAGSLVVMFWPKRQTRTIVI